MGELSVYKQIISGRDECLEALKREIGLKTNCTPFAMKLITAMKDLYIQTEQDATNAANTLLSGLQTLAQGGIVTEDYDKIDFVKRGKTIVPSARVEAFYRAAARKGYRITDTIIAVPKEDSNTTYFKENFYNGNIIYTLEDRRINPDRAINAERLVKKYFNKFICRLEIWDAKQNNIIVMTVMCDAKEHIYPIGEIMCQTAKKESKAVDCLIEKENRKILRREALQYLLIYYSEGKEEFADWKNEQATRWALMIAPELVEWYLKCFEKNKVHTSFNTNMFSHIILIDLLFSLHEKTRIVQCIKCKKFFVNNTNAEDCGCNLSAEEIEFRKEVDKMLSRRSEIDNKIISLIHELNQRPLTAETAEKHRYYMSYRSRLLKILERAINENLALDKIHNEFDKIEEELGFNEGGKEDDKIVQE